MRKFLKMKHQGFFIRLFSSFTAVLQILVLSCLMCAAAVSFSDEAQASTVLNGVNVETLADINHQDLQQILSHHYGQAVTAPLLQRVLDEITYYCKTHGYPTSKAFFKEQVLQDGVVKVTLLTPYLEKIRVNNRSGVNVQTRRRLLTEVMGMQDHAVNTQSMESALLRLADLGTFGIYGRYVQGQQDDGTELELNLRKKTHWPMRIFADNHGSKASGEYRMGGAGSVPNLSGYADKLSFYGSGSDEKQFDGGVSYSIPINSHPSVLGMSFSAGSYELSEEYEKLGAKGHSFAGELYWEEPWLRQREYGLKSKFGARLRSLEDRFDAFDLKFKRRESSVFSEFSGFFKIRDFLFEGSAGITTGNSDSLDDYALYPEGSFTLLNAWSRLSYSFGPNVRTSLRTEIQKASRPLDGALRFSAGGADKVSAFKSSEACADEGVFSSLELALKLTRNLTAVPHFDAAYLANKGGESAFIKGAGIKVEARYEGFFVNADVSSALGKVHGDDRAGFLLSFGYQAA